MNLETKAQIYKQSYFESVQMTVNNQSSSRKYSLTKLYNIKKSRKDTFSKQSSREDKYCPIRRQQNKSQDRKEIFSDHENKNHRKKINERKLSLFLHQRNMPLSDISCYQDKNRLSIDTKNNQTFINPIDKIHRENTIKTQKILPQKGSHRPPIQRKASNIIKSSLRNLNGEKSKFLQGLQLQYYIPDIKKSVTELNNKQRKNQYIKHLSESLAVFSVYYNFQLNDESFRSVHLKHENPSKMTLIFDLDETLIHSTTITQANYYENMQWGKTIQIKTFDDIHRVNLKIRPHAKQVLKRLKDKFQIGLFTASQQTYAETLLKELDPQNQIFSFKLFRQNCIQTKQKFVFLKDLRILKNRNLSKVILIDNSPLSHVLQKENAVPIISFFNNIQDDQLLKLETFLYQLKDVEDVREVLREYFKLDQYHNYKSMAKLMKQLY